MTSATCKAKILPSARAYHMSRAPSEESGHCLMDGIILGAQLQRRKKGRIFRESSVRGSSELFA